LTPACGRDPGLCRSVNARNSGVEMGETPPLVLWRRVRNAVTSPGVTREGRAAEPNPACRQRLDQVAHDLPASALGTDSPGRNTRAALPADMAGLLSHESMWGYPHTASCGDIPTLVYCGNIPTLECVSCHL